MRFLNQWRLFITVNQIYLFQVTQLQEVSQKERSQVLETQGESEQRHQEIQRLHQTLNTVKTNSQRQIDELQASEK